MSDVAAPITTTEPTISASIPLAFFVPDDGIRYEDRLISKHALAGWFGISENRLTIWAREGHGPRPIRIGGYKTAYRLGDALQYLRERSADTTPDVRKTPKHQSESLFSRI
jgi:hypothetical protein